jgi:hypothetical protein
MSTRSWQGRWAVVALVAGLAGSGTPGALAQNVTCPGASCDVVVTVTGPAGAPTVAVSATELRMKKGSRDPVITWKLEAPDYEFRADSIKPHTGAPVNGKQTTSEAAWSDQCTRLNTTGTAIRIKNRNTKLVTLYYDVRVYHKASGRAIVLDPAIFNDP